MTEALRPFPAHGFRIYGAWLLGILAGLTGCGGSGNSGGSSGPPPTGDYTLSVSPTSQSINAGASAVVSLSANASNGFSSSINVQVTGLPTGVSVSPQSLSLNPGISQQVTFSANSSAASTSATITFAGSSGGLKHTAALSLSVNAKSAHSPGRARYIRTDATTEYFAWLNQHWIVYHAATARFFVTDPSSNQILVMDAVSQRLIARLTVPGAFGIDDTASHNLLYVGTLVGDVYAIDPVNLVVTRRYVASQIGPYGFNAFAALGMVDGRVALLGAQGGIPSVDGSSGFALWNPTDNSITIYGGTGQVAGLPLPCGGFMGNIGGFTRSPDRTKIILGSIDSDGTLCEIDASTGQGTYTELGGFSLYHILFSPDGKFIIQPSYPDSVVLYDAQTLNKVTQFPVLGDTSSASGFAVSADSKTLFVPSSTAIYAYDLASKQLIGWTPNIYVQNTSGGMAVGPIESPYLLATDGHGLFVGPLEEGVGFLDLSSLQSGPVGTQFTNGYLVPAAGPVSGGTAIQWANPNPMGALESVYFDSQRASAASASSGFIRATTPPGTAGPSDVYAFTTDGGMQLLPDGFSYGPTILEVTPNSATVEGGGSGYIYGYGLGPASSSSIPADLQVTVGGVAARVTGFSSNAYGILGPPFPLEVAAYTVPPGVTGTVDITVSNQTGASTARAALTYLPPVQQFPLPGSALVQGIYDPYRDVYYFTDVNKIQVFSRSQGQWLAPIPIVAPAGATERLWGLALSPDGSKLAVSDASAGVIYVLNPATPSSVSTFPVAAQNQVISHPCGVAISNAGVVYFAIAVEGGTGFIQFFKLNTKTGTVTPYQDLNGPGLGLNDLYLRLAISYDNVRVFLNELGNVLTIDTATDKIFAATADPACCYGDYELALSSNQTSFTATSYLYDSDLNDQSFLVLNDREISNISYVYGAKLSPDGNLLFQPSTNGIDVFDGRLGTLQARISLPFQLSANYDALVANGKDNSLIAITGTSGNGIAVLDFTSISEPPPLTYLRKVSGEGRYQSRPWRHPETSHQATRRASLAPQRHLAVHITHSILPATQSVKTDMH